MNWMRYLMSIIRVAADATNPFGSEPGGTRVPSAFLFVACGDCEARSTALPASLAVRSSHVLIRLIRFRASFLASVDGFGGCAILLRAAMMMLERCSRPS